MVCALAQGDEELEWAVRDLLAADESAGAFLQTPAAELHRPFLAAGTRLGPYQILGLLGEGGMGKVYRGLDTRLSRAVAIKISAEQFSKRFEHEARAISALNHPNICTLYDVGPNYLVTELVEGETLRDWLQRGPALERRLETVRQVFEALRAAHCAGIVHRDLKPQNIMVRFDGYVKVLDFGLAKQLVTARSVRGGTVATSDASVPGQILGTVAYMSPEQIQGHPVDQRSDLFAVGIILFEMLTGQHPWPRGSTVDTLHAIVHDEPPPLNATTSSVAKLAPIVRKLLCKSPAERYPLAEAVLEALRSCTVQEGSFASEFLDSIAVLPFENVGGEAEMEYLSDGITTSIINNLSQLQKLRVVPRTTVFRYKGKVNDVAQAGRELRVRVVLTGQVAQRNDGLIVNAELIDTVHESQLWGANYNRRLEDIFPVQAEIAKEITNRLRLRLNDEEKRQLAKHPTESREAYHLLLKAVYWADKWTPEGVRKGVDYTRQAIDADPVYAEAWNALAYLYVLIGFFGGAPPIETFPKAKAAVVKALEIDDGMADAHATLSFVRLVYDWDWQGAQVELLRAIELGPNLAGGHYVYSHWYMTQKLYEEAMTEAKLALDIDPLSVKFNYQVGVIHYFCRRYDQAIDQLHEVTELDPLFVGAHEVLASAYARKGMRHDAMAEAEKAFELSRKDLRCKAKWGIISALAGEPLDARKVLDKLRQELSPPNFSFAFGCAALHALLGETDEAFACLDMAWQGRTVALAYVAIMPEVESLRDDPRFRDLLRRIGIPTSVTQAGPNAKG